MEPKVLVTDRNGLPREWTTYEEVCCYAARKKIVFTIGEPIYTYRGGMNADGVQSLVPIHPVIGVTGKPVGRQWLDADVRSVERAVLYNRDLHMCAYCGNQYGDARLTIDHIYPESRGGKTTWMNCITACDSCNKRKADYTPEEATKRGIPGMVLLYVPYVPTRNEKFILSNRNILTDQMDFLKARLKPTSKIIQNLDKYMKRAA